MGDIYASARSASAEYSVDLAGESVCLLSSSCSFHAASRETSCQVVSAVGRSVGCQPPPSMTAPLPPHRTAAGANIAGFLKVAQAVKAQGAV